MYWLGWEMGAVEAISLSILVGSSVDYCLHLVEGYLLAGETMPLSPDHNSVRECTLVLHQQILYEQLQKYPQHFFYPQA